MKGRTTALQSAIADVGEEYREVMILSTARYHGRGPTRLPDRIDRGRRVAAIQIETKEQAEELLVALDDETRRFYLDVEQKQDLRLMETAKEVVRRGQYFAIKPNDITVDALIAVLVEHYGADLSALRVAVNGSGNLGFKFALRLAESGCEVFLLGRDQNKVAGLIRAINLILPAHAAFSVSAELPENYAQVLVSAVTAEHVIAPAWLARLAPQALCLDVGINNFDPAFIEAANAAGHLCSRLDVRSAGDPLPVVPNPFFTEIAGRRKIGRSEIVAGGLIGRTGELVVDQISHPSRVIGVANGTGGLLPRERWGPELAAVVALVEQSIANGDVV